MKKFITLLILFALSILSQAEFRTKLSSRPCTTVECPGHKCGYLDGGPFNNKELGCDEGDMLSASQVL